MKYQDTLQYLFSQLPMYQRIGPMAMKKDLTNIILLCELLDNPQLKFKSVHVAGTNGKGSVVHILASILQSAGYKVACYTSPHYRDFRERIKINGEYIPESEVTEFVEINRQTFEMVEPSFFEITVAMAFDYFARKEVDIALIETGLGGRLDSTNILHPLISIITNISFDHQAFLGNTIELIATEKAGIIKQHTPVVIGESEAKSAKVFEHAAKELNAPIYFADQLYRIRRKQYESKFDIYYEGKPYLDNVESDLHGKFQERNMVTAMQATFLLMRAGFHIDKTSIKNGLASVKSSTAFLGRFEVLQLDPKVIMDSAHNEAGINEMLNEIEQIEHNRLHIVYGTVQDKDLDKALSMLPKNATYYFCKPDVPRGLAEEMLHKSAQQIGLNGDAYSDVKTAYETAVSQAKDDDLVLVFGSIFIVAEVL